MPQKKENVFRSSIHKHLDRNIVYQEKMHNPFRGGTFDDWYSGRQETAIGTIFGHDIWIEYKFLVKLQSVKADLTALQFHWGTERYKEGRNVAVIVGMPQGGIILHYDEWEKRIPVLKVEKRLLKRKQIAELITEFTTHTPMSLMRHELWEFIT